MSQCYIDSQLLILLFFVFLFLGGGGGGGGRSGSGVTPRTKVYPLWGACGAGNYKPIIINQKLSSRTSNSGLRQNSITFSWSVRLHSELIFSPLHTPVCANTVTEVPQILCCGLQDWRRGPLLTSKNQTARWFTFIFNDGISATILQHYP